MKLISILFVILVALFHSYFLYLEMFLWNTKKGMKIFGLRDQDFANKTKVLAANQGLYNGFLAAGLLYSLILDDSRIALFFLACVVIAGIFGALTTKNNGILWIQSAPALAGIVCILFNI